MAPESADPFGSQGGEVMLPRRQLGMTTGLVLALTLLAPAQEGQQLRGGLFSLPHEQDDGAQLDLATKDLAAERFTDAVERLQKLVLRGGSGVVPSGTPKLFVGARLAAIGKLRDLEKRGQDAYEKLVQRDAGALLRIPFLELKQGQLLTLAEEFPTSNAGYEARVRLGDLALEAGEAITASSHYRAARDVLAETDPRREALTKRGAAARALLGSQFALRRGESAFPPRSAAEKAARAQLETVFAEPPGGRIGWPSYGGGGAGALGMTRPVGKTKARWEWQVSAPGFDAMPMHVVGGIGGLFAVDGQSVWCLDPMNGQMRWRGEGPMVDAGRREIEDYEEGICQEMVLAAAIDEDVVVAALQVPNELEGASHRMTMRQFSVMSKIPSRRLFAFDRATGKRLWSHWDQKGGPLTNRFNGHDVAGPPMIVGGSTVYVATHDPTGAIQYYLSAYDLHSGRPKWRRLICSSQLEVNMFGNARHEFAAAPLAYEDGVVYATTNLGLCYAAEAETGRIRWISAYDVIPMPPTQLTNQMERPTYFANNPGVLLDGVFACTPVDSAWALGLDAETGRMLWKLSHDAPAGGVENQVRWLLGTLGDEFVFSGRGIVAVQAHPETTRSMAQARLVASPEMLGTSGRGVASLPRGAIGDGTIWFPTPSGLRVLDREGVLDPRAIDSESPGSGNLLLQDGILVTARLGTIEVHLDRESLLAEAERKTRQHPEDPFAWLQFATLVVSGNTRDIGDEVAERTEKIYRRGLQAVASQGLDAASPIGKRLSEGLFRLTFARAEAASRIAPDNALPLLRKARDEAPDAGAWIGAQLLILRVLAQEKRDLLPELARLAEQQGDVVYPFPEAGRLPVRAYAIWRGIDHQKTPQDQALRCQELLERFPEATISGERVREFVARRLAALLATHGPKIYAGIEERAAAALARARQDRQGGAAALRWVVETYPHSEAARQANLELLDEALERKDGGTALGIFGQTLRAGRSDARHLRRAILAAHQLANAPLEARLVQHALEAWRGKPTGFPADAGKPIDAVVSAPALPKTESVLASRPGAIVARLSAPGAGLYRMRLVDVLDVDGFLAQKDRVLLVLTGGEKLGCYDLALGAKCFDAARFETAFAPTTERPTVWRFGERVLLVESQRVRAIELKDGSEVWSYEAQEHRTFRCIGIQSGLAQIWSEAQDIEDGGHLIGLEVQSGAVLTRLVYENARPSTMPLLVGREVLALDLDTDGVLVLRHDDLTGAKLGEVRPARAIQDQLGFKDAAMARARVEDLARRWFADEGAIFLLSPRITANEIPRVFACDASGAELWSWSGAAGRTIDRAGLREGRVVIVEGSGNRGGKVTLVTRSDFKVESEQQLGGRVQFLGWPAPQRTPQVLYVTDTVPKLRLLCIPLDAGLGFKPFVHDLGRGASEVWQDPVLGDGCLLLPLRSTNSRGLNLVALDLRNERNDLLGDFGSQAAKSLQPPFQLGGAGAYIALLSDREVTLLGPGGATDQPRGQTKK